MSILFLAAGFWAVVAWDNTWWELVLSQLFFGVMCCSTFASLHETAHGTAFKSKSLNNIAAILVGIAHIYPATAFRELHFMHHRHTHIPGLDPEISLGAKPAPSVIGSMPFYLSWLSGFPLLSFKIFMLLMGAMGMPNVIRKLYFPFVHEKVRWKLALELKHKDQKHTEFHFKVLTGKIGRN